MQAVPHPIFPQVLLIPLYPAELLLIPQIHLFIAYYIHDSGK